MSHKIDELLKIDLTDKSLAELLEHLKKLTHELGNGTLTKLKQDKQQCKDMIKQTGEMNDVLGEQQE